MSEGKLNIELDDAGILTLTLDNPAVKNAFDTPMQLRLLGELQDAARNPAVHVVVLTGAGPAFCTGADVRTMGQPDPADLIAQQWSDQPVWNEHEARTDRLRRLMGASLLLHTMGKPTIAMVRGPAAGAGFALALACDFRMISETAVFVSAFARIGMSGDYGGSYFLTKLVGPSAAKEIYMLGDRIDAARALALGLANRLLADDKLESETRLFARRLALGPPIALRCIKENINAAQESTIERTFELEARNMIRCRLTEDAREAMAAYRDKREPSFKGI